MIDGPVLQGYVHHLLFRFCCDVHAKLDEEETWNQAYPGEQFERPKQSKKGPSTHEIVSATKSGLAIWAILWHYLLGTAIGVAILIASPKFKW